MASAGSSRGIQSEPKSRFSFSTFQPFVVGGFSGCVATCCIQPIDMVKVRIQLVGEGGAGHSKNPFRVASNIIKNEGFFKLYRGLDAGLIRQLTYTTARMGLFRSFSDSLKNRYADIDPQTGKQKPIPLWMKAGAGLSAGALAALLGNPADLALIRMQADATLPVEQRRNYTGVFNAMSQTVKSDGVLGLWRGSTPTMLRAMALNMGMLASNDQAKEMLQPKLGDGWSCTLAASAISGFFAVTLSLPFDFVKTRMQKMKADSVTGELPYKSFIDCARKTVQKEGWLSFYSGYPTYYVRVAPHAMITLICCDRINKYIKARKD